MKRIFIKLRWLLYVWLKCFSYLISASWNSHKNLDVLHWKWVASQGLPPERLTVFFVLLRCMRKKIFYFQLSCQSLVKLFLLQWTTSMKTTKKLDNDLSYQTAHKSRLAFWMRDVPWNALKSENVRSLNQNYSMCIYTQRLKAMKSMPRLQIF